ncbi:Na+/H+ antiporter subunit G [bacterium]|nr:Na+/H+ antiporter subunit G [bacterium]
MTTTEWIAAALLLLGSLLMLLSAIGLLRMPDLYNRLSAASKATSLGAIFLLAGFAVVQPDPSVVGRAIATILFVLVTVPVASHAIARAGYRDRVPLWKHSTVDEWEGTLDAPTRPDGDKRE